MLENPRRVWRGTERFQKFPLEMVARATNCSHLSHTITQPNINDLFVAVITHTVQYVFFLLCRLCMTNIRLYNTDKYRHYNQ